MYNNTLFIFSGTALGALLPPFFIDKNQTEEEISFDIRVMNIYYAVIACIVFIIVVLCKYFDINFYRKFVLTFINTYFCNGNI